MKNVRTLIAASIIAVTAGSAVAGTTATFNPAWQSQEVNAAWNAGYKGQGVTITVVDDFSNKVKYNGKLIAGTPQYQGHGYWTLEEAGLTAPSATMRAQQFGGAGSISLAPGLNVINASYGTFASATTPLANVAFAGTEKSLINIAKNGQAVVSKAAGNDAVAMGTKNAAGKIDFLAVGLKGTASTIYVGALNINGTTAVKSTIASYSNRAGTDAAYQNRFLMVGVVNTQTALTGTSFAAPIVSGYAAIVGSKFTGASATAISNQLLNTARTDTINGYNVAIHGKGEASLTRALAPVSIK